MPCGPCCGPSDRKVITMSVKGCYGQLSVKFCSKTTNTRLSPHGTSPQASAYGQESRATPLRHVTSLYLSGLNLSGLSSSVSHLPLLRNLSLAANQISATSPGDGQPLGAPPSEPLQRLQRLVPRRALRRIGEPPGPRFVQQQLNRRLARLLTNLTELRHLHLGELLAGRIPPAYGSWPARVFSSFRQRTRRKNPRRSET
ncbi:hypothetical protein Bca52824_070740 [Brassica carinata]|uniref:Uncharacterized protein n=1 Tax=Brassica carinata TaxID=52824 RepID=A0A8X7U5C9_BRACI|nr:hypothetical protein Bca52824_070740 [Brassica carinata]